MRVSKDHDLMDEPAWCLYHLLLVPRKWGYGHVRESGSLCEYAASLGIKTPDQTLDYYR